MKTKYPKYPKKAGEIMEQALRVCARYSQVVLLLLLSSCELDGSPYAAVARPPFEIDSRSILDSLRYLPEDPADMTASDYRFYRNKPWLVIGSIGSDFTVEKGHIPDYYEKFNMVMSHIKYLVHTREFADWIAKYAFVLDLNYKKSDYQNPGESTVPFVSQGLVSHKYRPLNTKQHVNPLEVLLLLRNLRYELHVGRNAKAGNSLLGLGAVGKRGDFAPKLPFTGWDPIADGGFQPQKNIWFSFHIRAPPAAVIMHEVMHNWGYPHDNVSEGVRGGWPHTTGGYKNVPYAVGYLIDIIYRSGSSSVPGPPARKRDELYTQRTKSGHLPTIYDVAKVMAKAPAHDRLGSTAVELLPAKDADKDADKDAGGPAK